jgi:hypothetical protein
MKNIWIYSYFLIFIAVVLGMLALVTPKPVDEDNHFSAERAYEDIKVISTRPHTVEDHIELENVRDYLIDRMRDVGLAPLVHTWPKTDEDYNMTEVNNILGLIPGTSNSYILTIYPYICIRHIYTVTTAIVHVDICQAACFTSCGVIKEM